MDLSPDEDNFEGRLLHQAALWDNVELLLELVSCGAVVDARDASGRTALHAAALADRSRCLRALCDAGALVDAASDASVGGQVLCQELVSCGAVVDARDASGRTALHAAALADRSRCLRALCDAGALVDAASDASVGGQVLCQELVSCGAVVDARDASGRTALHAAALADRSRCLRALCDAGALVDAASDASVGGQTALHMSAERGHVENIRTLLAAGADAFAPDAAGDDALALAERNNRRHATVALREHRGEAL